MAGSDTSLWSRMATRSLCRVLTFHARESFNPSVEPAQCPLCCNGLRETPDCFQRLEGRQRRACQKRVHVFPDDLSFFSNFEETAEGGLSDQCIAVRQTLRIAHPGREEIPGRLILVLPCDLVCGWIYFDHSRIRHRVVETVRPIIEYQDVAVREQRWPMLSGNLGRTEFPDDFSRLAGDANDCGGGAITRQDVAVGQLVYAVALRPKRARRLHLGDAIRCRIEMFPCPPLPDRLPSRSNFR